MSKQPTPKYDRLREMREENYAAEKARSKAQLAAEDRAVNALMKNWPTTATPTAYTNGKHLYVPTKAELAVLRERTAAIPVKKRRKVKP